MSAIAWSSWRATSKDHEWVLQLLLIIWAVQFPSRCTIIHVGEVTSSSGILIKKKIRVSLTVMSKWIYLLSTIPSPISPLSYSVFDLYTASLPFHRRAKLSLWHFWRLFKYFKRKLAAGEICWDMHCLLGGWSKTTIMPCSFLSIYED